MITPQDIREKTFEKVVFGGYDMAAVDNFLEEVANDLALLQKENATLKGKMKVLVDKVEEYRGNEDALRMAVISAQRLGTMIEKEARDRSDAMLNSAASEAARVTQEAALEVQMEKARLEDAKRASAQFIENMNLLCRRQMAFLEKLGQMDFVKEAAAASEPSAPAEPAQTEMHETVKSIEETVAKVSGEPVDTVHPDIAGAADDMATRAFSIVSDPDDDMDSTNQFSFDSLNLN